jgi:arginase
MPRYAIVEAPSALGHVPEHLGVERAPEVLLGAGLADGLAARRAGRIEAAGYSADRDPVTHVMNPQAIRDYSPLLADAVMAVLNAGEFPVVLGGDCSILLGTMLALRRRGVGERSCFRDRLRARRRHRHREPATAGTS